ncbi:MAG: endonuclease III domain-containing protein [Leptospirillum sp.]|jgi:endonuclease-3
MARKVSGGRNGKSQKTIGPPIPVNELNRSEQIVQALKILDVGLRKQNIPEPAVELLKEARSPFQVLIMTILSLRTRDPVTVEAFNRLCSIYPDAKSLSTPDTDLIGKLIFPVGFYRTKAITIKRISQEIHESGESEPPKSMEKLLKLPGVGLKTATLVRSAGWGLPDICVDTHVHRIVNRWGVVQTNHPDETYHALTSLVPEEHKSDVNRILVAFGQSICKPISPFCSLCLLPSAYCDRVKVDKYR